ncbi:Uncharacterised protein [Yersinia similis]|nr:Uncharacterised protein [Yersinia similis]CNC55382.1 Uncharacterised protein [Yersinia similis]CNF68080.1 Uncharacterised protein [Yersinia similis]
MLPFSTQKDVQSAEVHEKFRCNKHIKIKNCDGVRKKDRTADMGFTD